VAIPLYFIINGSGQPKTHKICYKCSNSVETIFRQERVNEVNMTKKELLYTRRREMYRLHVAQLDMSDILEKLSTKYQISKNAIDKDWQKRTQWVYDVFDLEPRLPV
jgi:hypothetical protein